MASSTFSERWTSCIRGIHKAILFNFLHPVTQFAAKQPCFTMTSMAALSLFLAVVGLFTNFHLEVNGDVLWTPQDARPISHDRWILDTDLSGFPRSPRTALFLLHRNGDNVLTRDSVDRAFTVLDTVRNVTGYQELCALAAYQSPVTGETTCEIGGVQRFWGLDAQTFRSQYNDTTTEDDIVRVLSSPFFPDTGSPTDDQVLFLGAKRNATTDMLLSATALYFYIQLPNQEEAAAEVERNAIDAILTLREQWMDDSQTDAVVETIMRRSFDDEFRRAIVVDLPLLPAMFLLMSIFTALSFSSRQRRQSRSLLGAFAVIAVLLSISSGYGLLFIIGVPFTSATQVLTFIIFGIGVDDVFVLMGAYRKKQMVKDVSERIRQTVDEAGSSITLTTLTSCLAFALGCMSSVPAVYWVCLYAFPTILFVYIFTLTFFVAAIVKDEKRIRMNRRDCLVCVTIRSESDETDSQKDDKNGDGLPSRISHDEGRGDVTAKADSQKEDNHGVGLSSRISRDEGRGDVTAKYIDSLMNAYTEHLLSKKSKALVLTAFAALFALCAWSTSQMKQHFVLTDLMPGDSYVTAFLEARNRLGEIGAVTPYIYFRYVDQSDPSIRLQMEEFVDEFVATVDAVSKAPPFFWVPDFHHFVSQDSTLPDLPFEEQLDAFLSTSVFRDLYGTEISRRSDGSILASRVRIFMTEISEEDSIDLQIQALKQQRAVAEKAPVNAGKKSWRFFSYDGLYNVWEFYVVSVQELTITTIAGVASVTAVTLLFIPHWSAAIFVLPLISVLYINLIGVIQLCGVRVNGISYVTLVMSIGLLVDFLVHVLSRYYDLPGNRTERVQTTLKSVGVSVLQGGLSTLLGTILLGFSTSKIFFTIFLTFLALVVLGLGHGLVLLPVLLSILGPEGEIV